MSVIYPNKKYIPIFYLEKIEIFPSI